MSRAQIFTLGYVGNSRPHANEKKTQWILQQENDNERQNRKIKSARGRQFGKRGNQDVQDGYDYYQKQHDFGAAAHMASLMRWSISVIYFVG